MSVRYQEALQKAIDLVTQYHGTKALYESEVWIWSEYEHLSLEGVVYTPPIIKCPFKGLKCKGNIKDAQVLWEKGKKEVVYLMYDVDGNVVYVGRTDNFKSRWVDHLKSDKPMHNVAQVELRLFDTKPETMFYEAQRIAELQPAWNIAGIGGKLSKQELEPIASFMFITNKYKWSTDVLSEDWKDFLDTCDTTLQ